MTLPWMAAKILLRPLADLRPHAGNARVHSAEQLEQIKASMLAFGFTNPLLVDEDGVLIAGHGRLEAATAIGMAQVPVIVLRHLSAAQRKRCGSPTIASRRTRPGTRRCCAMHWLRSKAAQDIDLGPLGFSADELADILAAARDAVSDGDAPEALSVDPAGGRCGRRGGQQGGTGGLIPPTPTRSRVRSSHAGDLWLLGDHRLLCATTPTPPPWCARWATTVRPCFSPARPTGTRAYTTGGVPDWDALMRGVFAAASGALRGDGQVLVNLGLIHREGEWQPYWQGWLDWMRAQGWRRFGLYAWDQGPGLPGDWNGRLAPAASSSSSTSTARPALRTRSCRASGPARRTRAAGCAPRAAR